MTAAAAARLSLAPLGREGRARAQRVRAGRRPPVLAPACALGDPHRVLGVEPGCDEATIKKAFRRLALRHHPDVSHAEHADVRFQAIQAAYDILLHRSDAEDRGSAWRWQSRARSDSEEEAPLTPEQQQTRWRSQLGGLQQRAASRERRDAESRYRAAMREHATRGSFSGCASSEAARVQLQEQLASLWQHAAAPRREALRPDDHAAREDHLLSAPCSDAEEPCEVTAAPTPPPEEAAQDPQASPQSAQDLRRLLRLARVARAWREGTGNERVDAWDGE